MSAKFEAQLNSDEIFEVEITHDLELIFVNYDFEYDQAANEFGYEETTAIKLAKAWQDDPMNVVEMHLNIPKMIRMLAACDWVERVLPIFEERAPKRVLGIPRMIVGAARQIFTNAIRDDKMAKRQVEAKRHIEVPHQIGAKLQSEAMRAKKVASGHAGYAAELVTEAILYLAYSIESGYVDTSQDVKFSAASAFAWYDTNPMVFPDTATRQAKKNEEHIWQVRRLIDVAEALQAGKPRPPMEATP